MTTPALDDKYWHDPVYAPDREAIVVRLGCRETVAAHTPDGWVSEGQPIRTPDAWRFMVEEIDI